MKKKPNILWFTSDQQRSDSVHAWGNEYIDTPNLDRLAGMGVSFTKAYCQNPICTPSRASFLTGRYPSAINANINGAVNLPEHCELISKRLADNGYYCGLAGKLHIAAAWDDYEDRLDDGFKYFEYHLGSGHFLNSDHNPYKNWLASKGVDWKDIFTNDGKHDYHWYREDAPIELRQSAWLAEEAKAFMTKHRCDEQPWFLSINCYDPHPPYDAPKALVDKYLSRHIPDPIYSDDDLAVDKKLDHFFFQSQAKPTDDDIRRKQASYYGMVECVDTHFGQILDSLKELGLDKDTIIIYNSDHGEMLGDHGLTHKGCRFYEGIIHVPLIISWPGKFKEGLLYDGITELTDVVPTILDIIGADQDNCQGRSLLPLLKEGSISPRAFVRAEYYDTLEIDLAYDALRNPDELDISADEIKCSYADMYFDGRYKLNVFHGTQYGQLFDIKEDPREECNLWDDPRYSELKLRMILDSYDKTVKLSRPGQTRRGRY